MLPPAQFVRIGPRVSRWNAGIESIGSKMGRRIGWNIWPPRLSISIPRPVHAKDGIPRWGQIRDEIRSDMGVLQRDETCRCSRSAR
jgi:hypothetical protein